MKGHLPKDGSRHNQVMELGLSSRKENFALSKEGILEDFLDLYRTVYAGCIRLEAFVGTKGFTFLDSKDSRTKANDDLRGKMRDILPRLVIDPGDNGEEARRMSEEILSLLGAPLKGKASEKGDSNRTGEGSEKGYGYQPGEVEVIEGYSLREHTLPCLRILHEHDWYERQEIFDPHDILSLYGPVQCMTIENAGKKKIESSVLAGALNDLAVKRQLSQGTCRGLVPEFSMEGTTSFLKPLFTGEGRNRRLEGFGRLNLTGDGSLQVSLEEAEGELGERIQDMAAAYRCSHYWSPRLGEMEFVLVSPEGGLCAIWDTQIRCSADPYEVKERLQKLKEGTGRQVKFASLEAGRGELRSLSSLAYREMEDGLYYAVGTRIRGRKLDEGISRAARVRRVMTQEGRAPEGFLAWFRYQDNAFVRNGELSVYPFPVKFLNVAFPNRFWEMEEAKKRWRKEEHLISR